MKQLQPSKSLPVLTVPPMTSCPAQQPTSFLLHPLPHPEASGPTRTRDACARACPARLPLLTPSLGLHQLRRCRPSLNEGWLWSSAKQLPHQR